MSQKKWFEGKKYEALVPDTLDLADRADFAINSAVGCIEEKFDYECWWMLYFIRFQPELSGPGIRPHTNQWFDVNPRVFEILTTMRLITGNKWGMDTEQKMIDSMFSRVTDGLMFNLPYSEETWWRQGEAGKRKKRSGSEYIATMIGQSVLLNSIVTRYIRDGGKDLLKKARKIADALQRIVIYKDDYAFYPATKEFGLDYSWRRESGWADTKEAVNDQDDPEGAVLCAHGIAVRALCRWYSLTGEAKALENAGKIVNYMLKPQFWSGGYLPWTDPTAVEIKAIHGGAERKPAAMFQSHLAGMAYALFGLIEYANMSNDAYLKGWVRQGYEYFRGYGLTRIAL